MAVSGFPSIPSPFVTLPDGRITPPWYRLLLDIWTATAAHTGEVTLFAGPDVPQNTLPCDHAAVSRITYRLLFSVIGTIYGVGDGSTTFNVPPDPGGAPVHMMWVIRT